MAIIICIIPIQRLIDIMVLIMITSLLLIYIQQATS